MNLPDLPDGWLISLLIVGLIVLRAMNYDSWTTATLSIIVGYLVGNGHAKAQLAAGSP